MAEENSMVILVTRDRVVYEVDLQYLKLKDGILATTEAINSPYRPYCDSRYQISRNGSRIVEFSVRCPEWSTIITRGHAEEYPAALDMSKTRLELNIFDPSGTADQVQTLELEYADRQSLDVHGHIITFSPDLSIVQAGAHVFDLLAPGHPRLSFPDNLLDKSLRGKNSSITFSSCNRYLVLVQGKQDVAPDESATCAIFRICRAAGKIEKVAVPGLDELVADGFSAAFHPELPLLMLICFTRPGLGVRDALLDARNPGNHMSAIEIDLEALKPTPIDIPEHECSPFDM